MPKLAEMKGVRTADDESEVELWRDDDTGRLMVVAYNQAGYDGVGIDLWDLIGWLHSGPGNIVLLDHGEKSPVLTAHLGGHPEGD